MSPHVRVYPPETVVAEKYEALVRLGVINSRVKDFYDLWTLASERAFTGTILATAISATFTRRDTPLPTATPLALTDDFIADPAKLQLWRAFVSRNKLDPATPSLNCSALSSCRPHNHGSLENHSISNGRQVVHGNDRPWLQVIPPPMQSRQTHM